MTHLLATASRTSSAVAETTTTVEELRQAAKVSSEKAKKVSLTARQALEISESGKKATQDTIGRMQLIKEQMESIGETVVRLSDHSRAIEEIIQSVQDIADQSNLLAVNASIEAAKAGEQGKGFAVVAQEVRSLAEQSKDATNQVRTILNDIQKAISGAVMATELGAKAVEAGLRQSQTAGDSIGRIAEDILKASQAAMQISASTNEQVAGIDQVSSAMGNINKATEQIVSGTRQSEESAKNLHELGVKLKQLVERYKV